MTKKEAPKQKIDCRFLLYLGGCCIVSLGLALAVLLVMRRCLFIAWDWSLTAFFIFMVIWLGLPLYLGSEAVVRLTETIFNNKQKDDLNNEKKPILSVDPKTSSGKELNQPQKIQSEINDNI